MRQCDNEAVRWCEKHAKSGLERRGKKRRQGNYFGGFGSQRLVAWLRGCRDEPVDVKFSAFGSPQLKQPFVITSPIDRLCTVNRPLLALAAGSTKHHLFCSIPLLVYPLWILVFFASRIPNSRTAPWTTIHAGRSTK